MTNKLAVVREFIATRWIRRLRTPFAVTRRQQKLLRRTLRDLRAHSRYFAQAVPDHRTPLNELPMMDKTVMMAHFDEMNTVGLTAEQALEVALEGERARSFDHDLAGTTVGLSSGTTGTRGIFLVSRAERSAWAGTMLARTLPRGKLWGHRIALFLRADSTLYESVGSRAITFEYFDIYADMAENARRLESFQPTILVAPPSVLRAMLDHWSGDVPVTPTKVYSVAEVLEPTDEARIRDGFDVLTVHQLYQCTEGFLAHSCEQGVLHLNEDNVIIEREMLDDTRFVPIVTDLRRRAQPIVRYRLGDVLQLRADPCPCGSALTAIARIEGREGDVLRFAGENSAPVAVFADQIARAIVHAGGVEEYLVTQRRDGSVDVAIEPVARFEAVAEELQRLFRTMHVTQGDVRQVQYHRDPSRKLRRVMREQ